jgi:plastocyanin
MATRRKFLTSAATVAAGCTVLLLAGCSSTSTATSTATGTTGSGTTATSSAATSSDSIVIQSFMFHPMALTVDPGATITVTNKDSATHTVTSTTSPPAFNSGNVAPGATVTFHAPDKAGTYSYICDIHQYMTGTLTVK